MNFTMARAESGSITQLGKNRWRVRVSGGNDPVTGKRIRLSKVVHGSKKDAIAERTRMQIEVGDIDRATKGMTFAEFAENVYFPWHKNNVRETSYYRSVHTWKNHVLPALGHIKMGKLSPYTIEVWLNSFESEAMRYAAFSRAQCIYRQAYMWEIVQSNPFDKVEMPTRSVSEKLVADPELAGLIIEAFRDTKIEPLVLIEVSCGLRKSEALALDWEDIDFRTGTVEIYRGYHHIPGKGCGFYDTKTAKSHRTVSIPPSFLKRLLEIRTEGGMVRMGALCIGRMGDRISPTSYQRMYKRVYKKKLPNQPFITLRNLRHSHATMLLAGGVDFKTISERLGHANIGITMNVYAQKVEELDRKASAVFDAAITVARPYEEPKNIIPMPHVGDEKEGPSACPNVSQIS